jgi:hypothetical protein
MAKSVTEPSGPRTGVVHLLNALAFSTLLSSQETDAHHQVSSRFPVGATLKLYPADPFVSTSFPEAFQEVAKLTLRGLRPRRTTIRNRAHAPGVGWKVLGGSRVQVRPVSSSTPWRSVPSGQDELYGCGIPSSNRESYPPQVPPQTTRPRRAPTDLVRVMSLVTATDPGMRSVDGDRGVTGGPEAPGSFRPHPDAHPGAR